MWRQFRQLRAAVKIPLLCDLSTDEPALHLHGGLAARARALLPARRHACGGRLVPAGRARARVFEAVLLGLSARRPIGRQKFLATLGGAAATWPLAARAQQVGRVPRIDRIPVTGFCLTRAISLPR